MGCQGSSLDNMGPSLSEAVQNVNENGIPSTTLAMGTDLQASVQMRIPFDTKAHMVEKTGDWLTDEYLWCAFCKCCKRAGREVTQRPEELFDFQHNCDYRSWTGPEKEVRGGTKYIIPKGWKRFALRVEGKFGDDNSWLRQDGGNGEWAVAYHGTSFEALCPIIQDGLRIGSMQEFEHDKDVRTGQIIGKGVYCTPSMVVAENYAGGSCARGRVGGTLINGHKVNFVLQCRVNPQKLKRCHDEEKVPFTMKSKPCWLLNDPQDIRPYAILVKESNWRPRDRTA